MTLTTERVRERAVRQPGRARVRFDRGRGQATVVATGDVDASTTHALAAAIRSVAMHDVRVDLSAVEFFGVSGLRAIGDGARSCERRGGRLVVSCASPPIRRLFSLADLERLLSPP